VAVAWGILIVFGLDDVLVALVGLAIVAAAVPLGVLAGNAARVLPWPFYLAADLLVRATVAAVNATVSWTEASANGIAQAIQAPWQAIWTDMRATVVASEHLFWAIWRVQYVTVPAVYSWAWATIAAARAEAIAHTDQVAGVLVRWVQSLIAQEAARADAEFAQAVALAEALAEADVRYAQQLALGAEARADAEVAGAIAHADAAAAAVAGYAATLAGDAITYTQQVAAGLETRLEGVQQADTDYARQLAGDLVQDIEAAEARAIAYAAAAAGTVAVAVQAIEDSPCMQACGALGELGQLLQGLEDAGLIVILLGLLAEVRHDPDAVQQVLRRDVVPIAHDALAGLGLAS
jgi:hypothetical protein